VAARRAFDSHRCRAGDAAVSRRRQHGPLAAWTSAYFNYRDTVCVDLLADFVDVDALAIHYGRTVTVEQGCIDVLVIENQQAVVALPSAQLRVHGEEVHSVVVHADLLGLIFSRVAGIFQPGRIAPGNRRAPRDEGGGGIA